MSSQNGKEIIGERVKGRDEQTFTNHLSVVAAPKDDPSVKTVIGSVIEENAVVRRTNVGGMSFVGVSPSQATIDKHIQQRERMQARDPSAANHDGSTQTDNVTFKVRLIEMKESINMTFPRNAHVKQVLEEIKKKKGVDVVLRMSLKGDDISSGRTLTEEGVKAGQILYAFNVEQQTVTSPVGGTAVRY